MRWFGSRHARVFGLCALCALAAGAAIAEPPPAEPAAPAGPTPQPPPAVPAEPAAQPRVIITPSEAPTIDAVRPNLPPPVTQDLGLTSGPPLMRESAFLASARGRIARGKSGRWYAIFDPDASGRQIPPMIVLENAHLAAMERFAAQETGAARIRISGRVTVYRDRNFLLPSAPPIVEQTPAPETTDKPNANAPGAPSTVQPKPGEPTMDQIIAEMEKASGGRKPGAGPAAPPTATGSQEAAESGVTSGFLAARRGRITRGADGSLMAVLDAGTAGRTEGPMVLLPCQNLAAIESVVDSGGEASTFTLSGEVFVYKGRRYLLPQMYTVNRATDIVMPCH